MSVDFIIDFESGLASDAEIIENFAKGIKDKSVWSLQGSYGRMAQSLIDNGYISEDGEILYKRDK